jgi:hypothetical protein
VIHVTQIEICNFELAVIYQVGGVVVVAAAIIAEF